MTNKKIMRTDLDKPLTDPYASVLILPEQKDPWHMSDRRDSPALRIAKVLRDQKEVVKSYSALERAIAEANGRTSGPPPVDRRKLRRIADGKDVSLTLIELRALDAFLTPLGEGLADKPLLERFSARTRGSRHSGTT
jgi:hypothetical protein